MRASVVSIRPAMEAAFCRARAGHFGGIDNAGLDEVFVGVGCHVVTFVAFAASDFFNDESAFATSVGGQLTERSLDCAWQRFPSRFSRRHWTRLRRRRRRG